MNWNWLYFGLGAVGALAPEVIRLYKLATDKQQFEWSPSYIIISVIFAAIGGLIAVALPASNTISAIYTGAAWPSLIAAAKQAKSEQQKAGGEQKGFRDGGAGPARVSFGSFLRAL